MNIALIGYGKMGKEIESLSKERGTVIKKIFTRENNSAGKSLNKQSLKDIDLCFEFSAPDEAYYNIEALIAAKKNIVCGTTGWFDKISSVKKLVEEHQIGFVYSSNFSLGMNIFISTVERAASLLNRFNEYDVSIHETHHVRKPDSPSGTAFALASLLLQNFPRKTEIITETAHQQLQPHQLHVSSTRIGNVVGQHTVLFDSEVDSLELIHTAKNRRGFALGAIIAAEWLYYTQQKGFFTMKDVLG
ncbi:MAG: 4-hydroxy-tetrahydrodipicolinate reductase [Ignavibacteria bacterium]|nr:4-hydroxy-tetrahydrodipicolinate reductase [Ignavibacteria bacterium]